MDFVYVYREANKGYRLKTPVLPPAVLIPFLEDDSFGIAWARRIFVAALV